MRIIFWVKPDLNFDGSFIFTCRIIITLTRSILDSLVCFLTKILIHNKTTELGHRGFLLDLGHNDSHQIYKEAILKNFAIFTGKHLCWSIFLIKLHAFKLYYESPTQVFSCKYGQSFKNNFSRWINSIKFKLFRSISVSWSKCQSINLNSISKH